VTPDRRVSAATAILRPNACQSRYGVAYLRSVCAQAGVGLNETSPDEDVLATDCDVQFREGNVRVQVKCTSGYDIAGRSASWPVKDHWLRAWGSAKLPVYLLLVIVPKTISDWVEHQEEGTFHRTAAFWRRLRMEEIGSRLHIPKTQRFSESTLMQWHADLLTVFVPGEAR
jgi:Domain of unknown function (DUF4365)